MGAVRQFTGYRRVRQLREKIRERHLAAVERRNAGDIEGFHRILREVKDLDEQAHDAQVGADRIESHRQKFARAVDELRGRVGDRIAAETLATLLCVGAEQERER